MSIKANLLKIKTSLPDYVTLVAVSKTKPISDLMDVYNAGQRVFGENKIQEMVEKHQQMPADIEWHMIGHVQSNKVKMMAPFVKLIHGVDSLKLLTEINKEAAKNRRVINCLLQVHIAEEETKFGLDENELETIMNSAVLETLHNIKVIGLMGMATLTENQHQIEKEFYYLKSLYDKLSADNSQLTTLSMGMSGDYPIAIECGSTMVRIGSSIFGNRSPV